MKEMEWLKKDDKGDVISILDELVQKLDVIAAVISLDFMKKVKLGYMIKSLWIMMDLSNNCNVSFAVNIILTVTGLES